MAEGGAALGKGAWDCDNNRLIPPEKEVRLLPACTPAPVGELQQRKRQLTAPHFPSPSHDPAAPVPTQLTRLHQRCRCCCDAAAVAPAPRLRCLRRLPPWTSPSRASPRCRPART